MWRNHVYATPVRQIPNFQLTIVHLEMLNVIIALGLWNSQWCHMRITMFCDNYSVVQVIMFGRTRDSFLALCIGNIWLLTVYNDIELQVHHIPTVRNIIYRNIKFHRIYYKNINGKWCHIHILTLV